MFYARLRTGIMFLARVAAHKGSTMKYYQIISTKHQGYGVCISMTCMLQTAPTSLGDKLPNFLESYVGLKIVCSSSKEMNSYVQGTKFYGAAHRPRCRICQKVKKLGVLVLIVNTGINSVLRRLGCSVCVRRFCLSSSTCRSVCTQRSSEQAVATGVSFRSTPPAVFCRAERSCGCSSFFIGFFFQLPLFFCHP